MKKRLVIIIFSITTILAAILAGIILTAFNDNNYQEETIINYLRNKQELNQEDFTEREITHMQDVRQLLKAAKILFYLSILSLLTLIIYLSIKQKYKLLSKCLIYGGVSSMAFLLLLFLLSISFNTFFTGFHRIFFTNNLWLLPKDARLIQLFPLEFFKEMLAKVFTIASIFSLAMLINGIILRYKGKYVHTQH